jgi:hypothetical protein
MDSRVRGKDSEGLWSLRRRAVGFVHQLGTEYLRKLDPTGTVVCSCGLILLHYG